MLYILTVIPLVIQPFNLPTFTIFVVSHEFDDQAAAGPRVMSDGMPPARNAAVCILSLRFCRGLAVRRLS